MILKHPAFPANTREVPDADADRWQAAGWLPLLDEEQTEPEDDSEDASDH